MSASGETFDWLQVGHTCSSDSSRDVRIPEERRQHQSLWIPEERREHQSLWIPEERREHQSLWIPEETASVTMDT
jgi:hypothetical protein